ncbi:MAG TPA: aminodeoxychorismate/anthranilate synthase component II [Beijerinckiaceae bacterium]|mgnify:CR=1|nr:aminodeoxychorismate/anthranilate synthase component II [Beijerinckiaceae bacterium]
MNLLLIDNYDSFTFNVVHLIGSLGATIQVVRNDELTVEQALARNPDGIVLSPGPCTPNEAGITLPLIQAAADRVPIFGVCLGHQAIGQAFGGHVVRAAPMHGKVSTLTHQGRGLFRGLNGPFRAARYHSLVVERASMPAELEITAGTDDGFVMSVSHRTLPVHGVQFHPESIASEHGATICRNFLELAAEWNKKRRAG